MRPSQLIANKDIDDAYDKLHAENETLRTERDALAQALEGILELEKHRVFAEEKRPEALLACKQVLETLEA